MTQFRKKPVVIEAWTVKELNHAAEHDWKALPQAIRDAYDTGGWVFGALVDDRRGIYVPTLEGSLFAAPDDWIIQGVKGEFYPCKPDIFEATYDVADYHPLGRLNPADPLDQAFVKAWNKGADGEDGSKDQ